MTNEYTKIDDVDSLSILEYKKRKQLFCHSFLKNIEMTFKRLVPRIPSGP